jgi:hypothetical protein
METKPNEITEDNIIDTILKLMKQVEGFIDKNGTEKKQYVMDGLRVIIGDEAYERYRYFISSFIDFAVSISKGKVKIDINNIKKKYCCF